MSSNDNPPNQPKGNTSKASSRAPSIRGDQEENTNTPTSTRPVPSSANSTSNSLRRDYGTLERSENSSMRQRAAVSRGQSSPLIRRDAPVSPALPPTSPALSRSQSRPNNPRRASSIKKPLPHRGEQFSVDDDPSEVEEDLRAEKVDKTPKQPEFPPLTRSVSTVRRRTHHVPQLPRVESSDEDAVMDDSIILPVDDDQIPEDPAENAEDELTAAEEEEESQELEEEEDLSDAESFTLRDRQAAINTTHPFGIRIWKPALYKKNRSVEKSAEEDIHSSPSQQISRGLWIFNCIYTLLFGWWLALVALLAAVVCYCFSWTSDTVYYARTYFGLARYLIWPFGQFVKLEQDDNYTEEDDGEGRSIGEYERWQSGDLEHGRLMFGPHVAHLNSRASIVGRHRNSIDSASEHDSLLGRTARDSEADGINGGFHPKRRLFGRGQWTFGRILFYSIFYVFIVPLLSLVAGTCWFLVFWIPMGRVLTILLAHLRKRPLALTFHPDVSYVRDTTKPSSIILCTYRAAGLKYWKYTYDGQNIFLVNSLAVVAYTVFGYFGLRELLGIETWFTHPGFLFVLGLISIIPLAYFIGQAVASISAQSSMGVGAAVNAFFSTIVEVYLYCIALNQGKGHLVEGSIIGSVFAGILVLPGLSMIAGAFKRKTQRFNTRSAGATQTLMLFAMIGVFGPTLFYKIYGGHEIICSHCGDERRDCRQCYFRQIPAITDEFFINSVRTYTWIVAVTLFLAYTIGLLFTLRTHAAVIWQQEVDEKKAVLEPPTTDVSPSDTRHQSAQVSQILPSMQGSFTPKPAIRESQLYKRIVGQTSRAAGLENSDSGSVDTAKDYSGVDVRDTAVQSLPHVVPPRNDEDSATSESTFPAIPGLSSEQNQRVARTVVELAATAATVAARDAVTHPRQASYMATHAGKSDKRRPSAARLSTVLDIPGPLTKEPQTAVTTGEASGGGHDAPNWSRMKSTIILFSATAAYAAVAEVLVDTVDYFLQSFPIDQKFLGFTLFALVPNTTEFLNAISFAMNGNIALSMEIASAYTLQVVLLQIPALVFYTSYYVATHFTTDLADFTFNLVFPQWDMVTVILCVLLYIHMLNEGKSNYFKGSIMMLTYAVVATGFYLSGRTGIDSLIGMTRIDPMNGLALPVGLLSTEGTLGREL